MNHLQVFDQNGFTVEVVAIDGQEWFGASKAAEALGYSNPRKAIGDHCRPEGVTFRDVLTEGGQQQMKFITEGNLYRLISRSKLPSAEQFERTVFDEILPTIRKHGGYLTDQKLEEALLDPDLLIRLATDLKAERNERKLLEVKVEKDKPKVIFADAVEASVDSILVRDMAKLLKQNGVDIGEKRLFQWLRECGFMQKTANRPTQKAMEMGIMELKEGLHFEKDKQLKPHFTPKITGKGQIYLINKFKAEQSA